MGNPSWHMCRGFLNSSGWFQTIRPPAVTSKGAVRAGKSDRTFLVASQCALHIVGDLTHFFDTVNQVARVKGGDVRTERGFERGRLSCGEGHVRRDDCVE